MDSNPNHNWKRKNMMGVQVQHPFNSRRRICMKQSSDDATPTPAEQFRPLQSVFRRRLLTGVGAASLLAAGANFGGLTSFELDFSPDAARRLKLDALYPVAGYSRYIDAEDGFEFVCPASWLGDQTLLYKAAGKAKRALDPSSLERAAEECERAGSGVSAAWFNRRAQCQRYCFAYPIDFTIEAFGGAEDVGAALIRTITRSDVKGRLIATSSREDSMTRVKYYELEFGVESSTFRPHNVAVCCARKGRLFTLNAQAPESAWPHFKSQLYTIAASFNLV